MKRHLVIAIMMLLATVLLASAQNGSSTSQQEKPAAPANVTATPSPAPQVSEDFVIGSGDVLAINVWKEPDVSRTLPVRPDGKISLPLVGDVQASGLTAKQLRASLEKALQAYIAEPAVTVIVQEVRSQTFNILGDVQRPGTFALTRPTTVLDAIALAGGFREWAKQTKIYVLRTGADGHQQRLPFNYKDVIKGKKMSQNIELKSGDTIIVP
jgi:polysaccharide export outer membrane protein